ncbi:hypothetical protein [Pedobacter gandavensis]|uniref:hypothetical protein n=1 Tax=Pedobacter gandavensis TaxID=2679963 RepID=UPI00292EFDE4|nr:hypothetical protein [Pedobacter gandavensis]
MNTFIKILYNCRKATFLIEKKTLSPLTKQENILLKLHLAGCSICRRFQQQSLLINKMIQHGFQENQKKPLSMNEDFKASLQQKIAQKWNKIP